MREFHMAVCFDLSAAVMHRLTTHHKYWEMLCFDSLQVLCRVQFTFEGFRKTYNALKSIVFLEYDTPLCKTNHFELSFVNAD